MKLSQSIQTSQGVMLNKPQLLKFLETHAFTKHSKSCSKAGCTDLNTFSWVQYPIQE